MNFRDIVKNDTKDMNLASVVGCGIDRLDERR